MTYSLRAAHSSRDVLWTGGPVKRMGMADSQRNSLGRRWAENFCGHEVYLRYGDVPVGSVSCLL
jgi:hypothetical protein